ncbi:MAG: hypothetical protein JXR47_06615 [Thiotrichales bacterium]|nr:hypothetical protein [Thiotrichales bacterium]
MKTQKIKPVFVEFIPEQIDEGVLYISERYRTATHKCCCGCGKKVVTPFSPVKWTLIKGHGVVSLRPSIGNWSYECQSHYFITNNQVVWAGQFSPKQIKKVQQRDKQDNKNYIEQLNAQHRAKKFGWFGKMFTDFLNWIKSTIK